MGLVSLMSKLRGQVSDGAETWPRVEAGERERV